MQQSNFNPALSPFIAQFYPTMLQHQKQQLGAVPPSPRLPYSFHGLNFNNVSTEQADKLASTINGMKDYDRK